MKFLIISVLLFVIHNVAASGFINEIPEEGRMNFTQLAIKHGFECEEFDVTTEDGYILKLFHIKGGNEYATPFLACHGNADNVDTFILSGNNSLAVTLGNLGIDAWYMNFRGSSYSRRHISLDPDCDADFWNWSFHDVGTKDLPVVVDFVLEKTKKKKLVYLGHSVGTEISYVINSVLKDYNDKFALCISLAPISFLNFVPLPTSLLVPLWPEVNPLLIASGTNELEGGNPEMRKAYELLCSVKYFGYEICYSLLLQTLTGTKPADIPVDLFQIVLGHYPSSTSRKMFDHLYQNMKDKRFAQYDYGFEENMKLYGGPIAPDYDLAGITAPFSLYVGTEDHLATPLDARLLQAQLTKSKVTYNEFPNKGHYDFVWGVTMQEFLYPKLIKEIKDACSKVYLF